MTLINHQFGEPLLTRISEIADKTAKTKTLYPLEVMGKYQRLKQITVRIGMPIYRIENGRTRTFQKEYLVTHPDAPEDLFSKDPESLEAQRAQHEILRILAEDENLLKEFQNGTQQTEPLIVTSTGVVVNGNRRLCAWRTLYYSNPQKYKHFEYIELAVLPEECDEKEIKALEKRLQIQKTHRAEYKWHNKAAMMKEERESGSTLDNLAKSYDVSRKDVDLLIGALDYAEIYLKKIGKKDQWSLVDDDEYAFKVMVDERKKISNQGQKELFEAICFKLIETKDYQGRLYSAIPDIAANLDAIVHLLQEKGLLPSNCDSPITNVNPKDESDLLGGEHTEKDQYSKLAEAVQDTQKKLGGPVKQAIEDQKAIKHEQKSNKFLVTSLSKVSQLLWNVCSNGLNEGTIIDGVQVHLTTIKEKISTIEKWMAEHQNK